MILFLIVQQPESFINRKTSEETILRERTKLLLQIIKEEEPEVKALSVKILKATYPDLNEILSRVEDNLLHVSSNESIVKIQEEIFSLKERRKLLLNEKNNTENTVKKNILDNNINLIDIEISKKRNIYQYLKNLLKECY